MDSDTDTPRRPKAERGTPPPRSRSAWEEYERRKRELRGMSPEEYEREITRILEAMML